MRTLLLPLLTLSAMLAASIATASSTITVSMAGEAFDGPPAFEVRLNGKLLGRGVLRKSIDTIADGRIYRNAAPKKYVEDFTYNVEDSELAKDAIITIGLINDKFVDIDEGHDRNVLINFVEVNGLKLAPSSLVILRGNTEEPAALLAGFLPIYENVNSAVARPPDKGWPDPSDLKPANLAERSQSALQPTLTVFSAQ